MGGTFGDSVSEEHAKTVNAAVLDITDRFNQVPQDMAISVICSFILTICCNQEDPAALFDFIGERVGASISTFMEMQHPVGNA